MNAYGNAKYRTRLAMGDKAVIIFFISIFLGTVIVNLIPFSYVKLLNVWGEEHVNDLIRKDINFDVMLKYLLDIRLRIFAVVFIMLLSPYTKGVIYGITGYLGAAWGIIASVILMEYGLNGIRLCFFMIFPHYIFYVIAFGMLGGKIMLMKEKQKGHIDITFFIVSLLAMLAFIMGIISEAYVNALIIKKIL